MEVRDLSIATVPEGFRAVRRDFNGTENGAPLAGIGAQRFLRRKGIQRVGIQPRRGAQQKIVPVAVSTILNVRALILNIVNAAHIRVVAILSVTNVVSNLVVFLIENHSENQ